MDGPRQAYLLDLDGTLVDSEPVWMESFVHAMALRGIRTTIGDFAELCFGRSWDDLFQAIHDRWPDAYRTREEIQRITEPFYREVCRRRDIAMPGARRLLRRLGEAGHPMAIVSGSTPGQIVRAIGMLGAERYVSRYVSCDDVPRGKPSPDGYLLAAGLLRTPPEHCIAVEDKTVGLQAALAAGMRCIVLQRPGAPPQDLRGAWRVVPSLDDV